MSTKKGSSKKGGFSLSPITLSEPVKATDGFTNLVEVVSDKQESVEQQGIDIEAESPETKNEVSVSRDVRTNSVYRNKTEDSPEQTPDDSSTEKDENFGKSFSLTETELLRILDADSLDEIYELTDVLRASSLKLYATLCRLADERGRARVKNHELMSKSGIKGIATLYKQERWLMDLKLLEKKAKPGPHDGSSYVVHKLETLPLPSEIYEKFSRYLSNSK